MSDSKLPVYAPRAQLCLASTSPRRRALLQQLKLHFCVHGVDIDESQRDNELPEPYVMRMAEQKAQTALKTHLDHPLAVLAADTVVVLGAQIFGKPRHKADAFEMWRSLSGVEHQVLTA